MNLRKTPGFNGFICQKIKTKIKPRCGWSCTGVCGGNGSSSFWKKTEEESYTYIINASY